jgi:hypothetical protein
MKHWISLFYLAQNVKDSDKNNSYIHTVATKLIELMSSQADPDQESPTHYTSLKLIEHLETICLMGIWNGPRRTTQYSVPEAMGTFAVLCQSIYI